MVNSDLLAAKRQAARDRVRLPINYLLFLHMSMKELHTYRMLIG